MHLVEISGATFISVFLLIIIAMPLSYMLLLMLASIRKKPGPKFSENLAQHRFVIAIPAHDEATVIGRTVERLQSVDYPKELFSIQVVADYCSDNTADIARKAGADVHERNEGPRSGKGSALKWLFNRILYTVPCDAVIVFDADTQVDRNFLRTMNIDLGLGHLVIQGNHIISNPEAGWFPALTAAMFIVDNRYQNLGRSNLGWSAKNMGDSICLDAEILRRTGWGEGLTEDYQLRQRLLLEGVKIFYEPAAIGYGEAALNWSMARTQRERWLRGTTDSSHHYRRPLIREGIRRSDLAIIEGGLQALLPSYSSLTLITAFLLALQIGASWWLDVLISPIAISLWAFYLLALFLYPFVGLFLERVPARLYLAMLSGFIYIGWRTLLSFQVRFTRAQVTWKRTPHGQNKRTL